MDSSGLDHSVLLYWVQYTKAGIKEKGKRIKSPPPCPGEETAGRRQQTDPRPAALKNAYENHEKTENKKYTGDRKERMYKESERAIEKCFRSFGMGDSSFHPLACLAVLRALCVNFLGRSGDVKWAIMIKRALPDL